MRPSTTFRMERILRDRLLVVVLLTLAGSFGCSSSADEEDINAENNSNSENVNLKNNQGKNNNFGEDVNNSTKNEFVDNQGNMGKVGNAPPPMSNSTNSLLTNNASQVPPANPVPLNSAPPSNAAPVNPAPAPAAVVPVTGGPDGRGRVRYARRPVQKFQQAGGTGTPVGSLEQGDHPLVVKEEGTWNQLSNGTFVDGQSMSDEGIGRPRPTRDWR